MANSKLCIYLVGLLLSYCTVTTISLPVRGEERFSVVLIATVDYVNSDFNDNNSKDTLY